MSNLSEQHRPMNQMNQNPLDSDIRRQDFIPDLTGTEGTGHLLDQVFTRISLGFGVGVFLVMAAIVWVLVQYASPAIAKYGLTFFWERRWEIDTEVFGGLPYLYGSLVTSALAFSIAVPIGVAVALVTSEDFLPPFVRTPIAFMVELIAAIPSVIIGLWGIYVFIPMIKPIQDWLYSNLGSVPLFSCNEPDPSFCTGTTGQNMLTAALILGIMILPTVAAISRDVLLAVPKPLRSASMALGATRWETIFSVMLPTAVSGITGAAMLALGRALGETMAVTMVIGNVANLTPSLLSPGSSIPAVLANEFSEALSGLHIGSLMYLALSLLVITLAVNIVATWLIQATSLERQ